jgi:hypothetical protein
MTDKFAPGERRNASEIMSAPTQVGGLGDGTGWESGPDFIAQVKSSSQLRIAADVSYGTDARLKSDVDKLQT